MNIITNDVQTDSVSISLT